MANPEGINPDINNAQRDIVEKQVGESRLKEAEEVGRKAAEKHLWPNRIDNPNDASDLAYAQKPLIDASDNPDLPEEVRGALLEKSNDLEKEKERQIEVKKVLFETFLEDQVSDETESDFVRNSTIGIEGVLAVEVGNFALAKNCAETVLEESPGISGKIALKINDAELAKRAADNCIRKNYLDSAIDILVGMGNEEKAREVYETLKQKTKNLPGGHTIVKWALHFKDDKDVIRDIALVSMGEGPYESQHGDSYKSNAYQYGVRYALEAGDKELAKRYIQEAPTPNMDKIMEETDIDDPEMINIMIKKFEDSRSQNQNYPKSPIFAEELGELFLKIGDKTKANENIDMLLSSKEDDGKIDAYDVQKGGNLALKFGDLERAKMALKLLDDSGSFYADDLVLKLGDEDIARKTLEKYQKKHSYTAAAKIALALDDKESLLRILQEASSDESCTGAGLIKYAARVGNKEMLKTFISRAKQSEDSRDRQYVQSIPRLLENSNVINYTVEQFEYSL